MENLTMNIMNKKTYMIPCVSVVRVNIQPLLSGSTLNPEDANPTVVVSDEQYGGTFSSRGNGDFWDDED